MSEHTRRRFRIALSFPGEHRLRVEAVATLLAQQFSRDEILYDQWHTAEFARPNLDVYLTKLFRDESDLIVIFLCAEYEKKEWCGIESRAWREIIERKQDARLMFLRLDDHQRHDIFSVHGYLSIRELSDTQVATEIISRAGLESEPVGLAAPSPASRRTSIQHLPAVAPAFFGRDAELTLLEIAWKTPWTNFIQVVGPGGIGKSALMTNWYRRHLFDASIFGWSFYSQGTREKSETSSEPFFNEFLRWLDITIEPSDSLFHKVDLIVDRLRRERILLILDGLEPLQQATGELRDLAIKSLLKELDARNKGLVLVTTRIQLTEIRDQSLIRLDNLSSNDGAEYLKHLGIEGTDEELRAASQAYENHALALTLFGTYLRTFCESDVHRSTDIKDLTTTLTRPGRHAQKVMASYTRMYEGRPELYILRALGYFDRPVEPEALKLVLPGMPPLSYRAALTALRDARLILTAKSKKPIDCHPLVREYFAAEATKNGHLRLYEYYKGRAPRYPDSLKEMEPLFHAVYHGCRSGRHGKCLQDVYRDRIVRNDEFYLVRVLGASATDLSLLANFFEACWNKPIATLSRRDQAWVFNRAGFALRAVGRLVDAVELLEASTEVFVELAQWKWAANTTSNLSQLHLTLGNIAEAVIVARRSAAYADRSKNAFERILSYTALADALHQSANRDESLELFRRAEFIQARREPNYPLLYSIQGYGYCKALLDQGDRAEVARRVSITLHWAEDRNWLLSIGHDHLTFGRAHLENSRESIDHLDKAVDYMRSSGFLEYLPRALLARGRAEDIEEAYRIASRCGMGLYLKDPRLANIRS
jgi:tetratricopeptide (TPR) repeat protein